MEVSISRNALKRFGSDTQGESPGARATMRVNNKIVSAQLLRKRLEVFFHPVAILWHGLQRWAPLGPTSTWSFHLGYGHARTGFRLQASTDVNDTLLVLRRAAAQGDKGRQEQQNKESRANSISHGCPLKAQSPATVVFKVAFGQYPLGGNFI